MLRRLLYLITIEDQLQAQTSRQYKACGVLRVTRPIQMQVLVQVGRHSGDQLRANIKEAE